MYEVLYSQAPDDTGFVVALIVLQSPKALDEADGCSLLLLMQPLYCNHHLLRLLLPQILSLQKHVLAGRRFCKIFLSASLILDSRHGDHNKDCCTYSWLSI